MYPIRQSPVLKKNVCILLSLILFAGKGAAQTTYLPFGSETYPLLDRMEARGGKLETDFYTTLKPLPRSGAVRFLEAQRAAARPLGLSRIDRYNIDRTISVNGEWAADGDGAEDSKTPWFRTFYKKKADFLHVNTKDFFLAVNPVISAIALYEQNTVRSKSHFSSSRGIELRGRIAEKVGFYTYVTDNQEQPPDFISDYTSRHRAVPGADFYNAKKNHYDYLIARGYIDFSLLKDHLSITLGHDRHFIGDGLRSLILSDFSAGTTFLQLHTRIGRLQYQNLYLELTPQFWKTGDERLPRKYATIHTLHMNVTRWLNIGVFESILFSGRDQYKADYALPVIFYHTIAGGRSADNVNIGVTFKAIALRRAQFYGQFLLNDIKKSSFFTGDGSWRNRYGLQLGAKYFDAFTISNLDLQAEWNFVRPYTYTSSDSVTNYTHYNQPLAHPLGAGFSELSAIARYQPVRDLFISLKGMYYIQGSDTKSSNYGNNIFLNNQIREKDQGIGMTDGIKKTGMLFNVNLSYMLRENLFIDLGATHRQVTYEKAIAPAFSTNYMYLGFRLNIARRDYDFY